VRRKLRRSVAGSPGSRGAPAGRLAILHDRSRRGEIILVEGDRGAHVEQLPDPCAGPGGLAQLGNMVDGKAVDVEGALRAR